MKFIVWQQQHKESEEFQNRTILAQSSHMEVVQ